MATARSDGDCLICDISYRSKALPNNVLRGTAVFAFLAILAIFIAKIPFLYIVLMATVIGYLGSQFAPEYFKAGGHMMMRMQIMERL